MRAHNRRLTEVLTAVAVLVPICAPAARAAWPGVNGRLAYDTLTDRGMEVRTSTLDGHGRHTIATIPPLPAGLERVSGGAQWSPDGRRLVYEDARFGVRIMRPDGRGKRLVSKRPIWPSWSPDGRTIIGVDQLTPPFTLYRVGAGGGGGRRIAAGAAISLALPRWSPTGRWIAFETGGGDVAIWLVRPSGRDAHRLVAGHAASWSPDGRRLAFALGPDIYSIRSDGRGRRRLHAGPRDSSVVSLGWSPDGRSIVLVRQYPADAHDRSDVDTIPARGGRERVRFSSSRFIGRIDWGVAAG
jgi:Tol biopolymer transport system component